MKKALVDRLSRWLFDFCQRWRSRDFVGEQVNWRKSGRTGPVQFEIGRRSYANGIHVYGWQPELKVTVGKFCSIAEDVVFMAGGEHDYTQVSTSPIFSQWNGTNRVNSKGSIVVGHDVWIGHGATILSGVNIGHGAVVGARALVTKTVPPYAIVGGNPARVIKYRFDPETIRLLLLSEWWDWDEDKLRSRSKYSGNIRQFLGLTDPTRSDKSATPTPL